MCIDRIHVKLIQYLYPWHFICILKVVRGSREFAAFSDEVVAFSVYDGSNNRIPANERVRYNDILSNVGAGYRSQEAEFVCPFSG